MNPLHIVVCGSIVPDPLQTLEPIESAAGPALRNEALLPAIFDPWAATALYEAAHLARQAEGTRLWVVSLAPKAKTQQVMMSLAQKAPFELVLLDGPAHGFTDAHETAMFLAEAIEALPGLERERLLLFGGWESASRGQGATLSIVGERLGIRDQFQGVDRITLGGDGSFEVMERVEGGRHLVSRCAGPPAVLGWATGERPEPRNDPQMGMKNMRLLLPALGKAQTVKPVGEGFAYQNVQLPSQRRQTRIVKDQAAEAVAAEILEWMRGS